ncbi:MAG: hypothetical protein ACK40T_10615 [Akkermansiaceae bacterium]|jgi:hypothetical protein
MEFKAMKQLYRFIIIIFIFNITGCHPNPPIYIINRSKDNIFIIENNKNIVLKNDGTYESKFYSKNNQEITLYINSEKKINVREKLSEIDFEFYEKLNKAYPRGTGDLHIIIKNKKIYLGSINEGDLKPFSVQPNKFPLNLK